MFDKKTQAEALERMVAFHTRAGNTEAATAAQAELDGVLAQIEAETHAEVVAEEFTEAVEVPIEAPHGKKIRKAKSA